MTGPTRAGAPSGMPGATCKILGLGTHAKASGTTATNTRTTTAVARLEAAQTGLMAAISRDWDKEFVILAALRLLDAAIHDLEAAA